MIYKNYIKPTIDKSGSLILLVLISPIFLLTVILLSLANKGTPFFVQIRPGLRGELFKIIKFKTMNDLKDKHGMLLPDEKRLTKVGLIVRKLSIDELPQLVNVLKGDMSIIGPRPLLPEYLPLYSEYQNRRHEVKPGITGWAQVNGRNAISWEEKFKLDVWYVENRSFMLDLKIMILTIKKVFIREGINSTNSVTMEAFRGN